MMTLGEFIVKEQNDSCNRRVYVFVVNTPCRKSGATRQTKARLVDVVGGVGCQATSGEAQRNSTCLRMMYLNLLLRGTR